MKNYIYTYTIKERNGKELDLKDYTKSQIDQSLYIDTYLSKALIASDCGWDNLLYKVIKYPSEVIESYMVLCVHGNPERWIPITATSKASIFKVLGENIF